MKNRLAHCDSNPGGSVGGGSYIQLYSGYLVYVMIAYVGICPYCLAAHATNAAIVIRYTTLFTYFPVG